jgi:hypothetical protein
VEAGARAFRGVDLEITVEVLVHQLVILGVESGHRHGASRILGRQVGAHENKDYSKRSEKLKSTAWFAHGDAPRANV